MPAVINFFNEEEFIEQVKSIQALM